MTTYSIGELAQEFEVTTRAIRFYEDQGLLSPARNGQARVYSVRDRVRLKLVLRGKRLGFSLGEIGGMLDLYDADPSEVGQLQYFVSKLDERRAQLNQQQQDIQITLKELDDIAAQCNALLVKKRAS
ncbi:MAG: MerR family DNA-binding transcriptional regulator [Proteobacteria bacterium]|nr:MAG: MerR family DNA-binding transcriptional regulator [Pseudomonadota bacterium]TDJ69649.1 MAG: MerR family DNA-binding transcriptional regulator [Pseudomonadota bacterium]